MTIFSREHQETMVKIGQEQLTNAITRVQCKSLDVYRCGSVVIITNRACLSKGLGSQTKTLVLSLEDVLDLAGILLAVELASKRGQLGVVDLGDDGIDVVQSSLDLGSRGVASSVEVVGILDGTTDDTLVLLSSVLRGLLGLLALSLRGLLSLLGLLSKPGLFLLGLGSLLSETLLLGLLRKATLVLLGVLGLAEELDALVESEGIVDQVPETGGVLGLLLLAGGVVLALDVALLVTALAIVGNVLVEVLKGPPAVEVVPEVVEVLDVLLGALRVSKLGHGLLCGEAALGLEDLAPQLVEVALLGLLLGRRVDLGSLVDRVELPPADGVGEDLVGLLDALEELVVLGATGGGPLVGVVLEHLPAVGALDLLGGGLPAVAGYAEDGVVVLRLPVLGLAEEHLGVLGLVNVIGVLLLNALNVGLGLDALILGESALVADLDGLSAVQCR